MISALFLSLFQLFILKFAECDYRDVPGQPGFVKWSCTR